MARPRSKMVEKKSKKQRVITLKDDYMEMADKSEGFDVCPTNRRLCGGICELKNPNSHTMKQALRAAKAAVDDYNKTQGLDLVFDELVKANAQVVSGCLYYLTIRARRPSVKRPKLYQAKVWIKVGNTLVFRLFREKPPRPYIRRKKSKKSGAKPGSTSGHQKTKEEEVKSPLIPKGAFFSFLNDLRMLPELPKMRYCHITRLASRVWRSMSAGEKENYCETGTLKYEDVVGFMPTSCE